MKVTLYAVGNSRLVEERRNLKEGNRIIKDEVRIWAWYLTLDLSIDKEFWSRKQEDYLMIIVEPQLPLGQAVEWKDVLSVSGFNCSLIHQPGQLKSEMIKCLGGLAQEMDGPLIQSLQCITYIQRNNANRQSNERLGKEPCLSEAERLSRSPCLSEAERLSISPCLSETERSTNAQSLSEFDKVDPLELEQFAFQLQGRSLLIEEIVSFMEHLGISGTNVKWRSFVQIAYLQGKVELHSGLFRKRKRTLPLLKNQEEYYCRRCGSGRDHLNWTQCASCGEQCAYCEECLTMGRVRMCSLLVNGLIDPKLFDEQGVNNKNHQTKINGQDGNPLLKWGLSPSQYEAAAAGIQFLTEKGMAIERPGRGLRKQALSWLSGRKSIRLADQAPRRLSDRTLGRLADQVLSWLSGRTLGRLADQVLRRLSDRTLGRLTAPTPPFFLIWAVTGAGKTEMIYPLIEVELSRQGKVLIATPRKDVVLELEPRLKQAFPDNKLVTLYGGSAERWESGEITLATTHQLLRFWCKFDLVIIDEMDAYPFHNNPMLEFAATKVCRPSGKYILLSATPPVNIQKAAEQHKLPYVMVPVRFHRHPLPVPRLLKVKPVRQIWDEKSVLFQPSSKVFGRQPDQIVHLLPRQLYKELLSSLERGAQLFVFVPKIKYIEPLVTMLRNSFAGFLAEGVHLKDGHPVEGVHSRDSHRIEGTSSKDPLRRRKVSDFRSGEIRILVTTTILERGVTVPKTDVFVMDADSPMFDEAALVQMAGRAGRSSEDPTGRVYYAAHERTQSQVRAIRQITQMNGLARKKGYLISKTDRQRHQ